MAAWKYLENYWTNQDKLFIPRNLDTDGHMKESAYVTTARDIPEIEDAEKLQEWTALYYALIEEIDAQVGILLEQLGDEKSNTLVIFTSDHGEVRKYQGIQICWDLNIAFGQLKHCFAKLDKRRC